MATGQSAYIEDFYYAGDFLDKAFDIMCYRIDDCHFVCIFRDITERKKAEERLRDSEARFRATFDQAAVGVAHVAPDGKFVRINRKFCDIVGYTREEMLERTFQDITHPDDLNADLDLFHGEAVFPQRRLGRLD
jgi:PAS domain-containing protein